MKGIRMRPTGSNKLTKLSSPDEMSTPKRKESLVIRAIKSSKIEKQV